MARLKKQPADALEKRLASLERQVATLRRTAHREGQASKASPGPKKSTRKDAAGDPDGATMALVERLAQRRGPRYAQDGAVGAVGYAGFVRVDERRYAWARETSVPDLLNPNATAIARVIAAVGSPQRIALLRALFGRDRSSAQLAAVLGDPSPGHVYHHLKELQASGILVQAERGVYRIAPTAFLAVLMILAAANDILSHRPGETLEPFPSVAVETR